MLQPGSYKGRKLAVMGLDKTGLSTVAALKAAGAEVLADAALGVPRGSILDRNGVVLAESVPQGGVYVRRYPTPDTADVTGYFSPLLYGATGLEIDSMTFGDANRDRVVDGADFLIPLFH